MRVFLFLATVLADEGAVFIKLSVPALPVVHQAVVALVTAHRPVGRRPAALQRLVVLSVTLKGRKRVTRISQWSKTLVPHREQANIQASSYYMSYLAFPLHRSHTQSAYNILLLCFAWLVCYKCARLTHPLAM